ncbi:MAG: hypothetical protein ACE5H2_06210 [Terriglobia bacterium]
MREFLCRLAWLAGALAVALTVGPEVGACRPPQTPKAQSQQPPPEAPKPPAAPEATAEARPAPPPQSTEPASLAGVEPEQVFLEFKYAVNGTDLNGNKERSFLNEGTNHVFEFSSFVNRSWGIRRVETLSVFRYTDDPRTDPERNSLQRAYLRLQGPTFEAALGDHLASYSRFTFNQNIKGLNIRKDLPLGSGLRLTGIGGVFSDRWGSLFRDFTVFTDPRQPPDSRFPSKPYTRLVLGLRGEQKLGESSSFALSYSQGSDVIRSLPREAQTAPVNNQVVGFDTSIQFGRNFRFLGEIAYSLTQFDARFQPEKRNDYALRGELSHRWRLFRWPLSWRAEYALFMPNFFSANARQVQDLQDASVRATLDLTSSVSLQLAYRRTNDNIPGRPVVALAPDPTTGAIRPRALTNVGRGILCRAQDTQPGAFCAAQAPLSQDTLFVFDRIVDEAGNKMTAVAQLPEGRLSLRPLPFLQVDLGYRERRVETSNKNSFQTKDPTTGEAIRRPLFRARITKMPFVDINLSTRTGVFTLSYEYRRNRDPVRWENSTFTHRVAAGYSGSWFFGGWTVGPRFRYETERISKQLDLEPVDDPVSQTRLQDPNTGLPLVASLSGGDQTRSLQGSLVVEFPKYFALEVFYRELNAKLLSGFASGDFFPVPSGGFSQTLFGNGGFRRPSFRAQLTYKIRNDENRYITLTVERSVNSFALPDPQKADERSFRENVLQLSFVWRLRRQ